MANLGGKIELDISEFQAKITEANKRIRENESAWREAAAGMGDWTKSEDGLRAKLEASNKQIELQREIMATLAEKKKALVEEYGAESREVDRVNAEIIKYSKALEKSIAENKLIQKSLDSVTKETNDEKTAVERATKVTKENTTSVARNAVEYGNLTANVKKASDGFTILKGVIANVIGTAITSAVKGVASLISAINQLPETTKALRRELSQIETAFGDAGFSAGVSRETFIEYSAVLGEIDSNANTTISLLASLSDSEKDLTEWTTVLTGVYAKLGVAIPTNELVKNIQQTANTGKMTENLTKVLASAGIDTDAFTKKITELNSAEERSAVILTTLNNAYGNLGASYISNNSQMIEAEKAQLKLNVAMTKFGNMLEPIKTGFTTAVAGIVDALGNLLGDGDDKGSALNTIAYNVGYMAGKLAKLWDDVYTYIEPYLIKLKDNVVTWFDDNKDAVMAKVKSWLTGIFGADTITAVSNLADTIVAPVKKVFDDIENEDWEALGVDALPVITIGIGASLLAGAVTDLPGTLTSALSTAFSTKSISMAGVVAGCVGVIALGVELKDAMETGDYTTFANKALQSILDGLAVYGVTGSLTAGAFAFALSATLDVSVTEFAGDILAQLGLKNVSIGIGASLLAGATTGVRTALTDGLSAGLGKAWTATAVSTGVLGTVAIGLKLKDALTTGDYEALMDSLTTSLIAGLAVAGITGSIKAGVIAFGLSAQLGLSLGTFVSDLADALDLEDDTIELGLSLATGAVAGLVSAIKVGFSGTGAFGNAWTGMDVSMGLVGAFNVGMKLVDAMNTGDYETFASDVLAATTAALAVYGLTYNAGLSAFVFNVVLKLNLGSKLKEWLKDPLGIYRDTEESLEKGYEEVFISPKIILKAKEIDTTEYERALEKSVAFDDTFYVDYKVRLESFVRQFKNNKLYYGAYELAEMIAEGYGLGLEKMDEITEQQAYNIITVMREVLDIHSPSKVAKTIGENFADGFEDGYSGVVKATEEIAEEIVEVTEEKMGFWAGVWDNIKSRFVDMGESIKSTFTGVWSYVKKSFTSWEGFFGMLKDGFSGVGKMINSVGEGLASLLDMYDVSEGAESIYNGVMENVASVLTNMGGWFSVIGIVLQLVLDALKSGDAEEYIRQLVEALIEGVNMIFENTPLIVKMVLHAMKAILEGLIENLPVWLEALPDIIAQVIDAIIDYLPEFIQLGWELCKAVIEGIWKAIKSIGRKIVDGFKSLFGINSPSKVMKEEVGKNLALGVAEGIEENIPAINRALAGVNTQIVASSDGRITNGVGGSRIVNVNQYNNYSKSYSAYELYKSERAIKQMVGAY